jgi:hypothetical protein
MNPRTDTTVGHRTVRAIATTRQGMPLQDQPPPDLWPTVTAVMAAASQGLLPAHSRHAISTRVHQKGGEPTRLALTRRAHPPRPPPHHRSRLYPAPLLDHPLPGTRIKGAYGVATRALRAL